MGAGSNPRARGGSARDHSRSPVENGIPPEAVRAQLARVLGSEVFCHSDRMGRFLPLAVEATLGQEQGKLKEYLIGVEVFDRNGHYDPRVDPIVRVEARRLRSKLAQYYETEGRNDPVVIAFPKGGYVPVFEK